MIGPGALAAQRGVARRPATIAGVDLTAPVARWQLPPAMREASGLAVVSASTVLVHGDERGILFEVDFREGTTRRVVRMGTPVLRGDFEGIVAQGDRTTLMTGDGYLVTGRLRATSTRLDAVRSIRTGLERECELEGLAVAPEGHLLIPCKQWRRESRDGALTVWAWSTATSSRLRQPALSVPFSRLGRRLHPSDLVVTTSGTYVLLFGREHAIGEFSARGDVLALFSLDRRRHPQPEGIALTADGLLLIADEASSDRTRATLTVYAPPR